jgi:O-antigen/teichoic acid export membrane protein
LKQLLKQLLSESAIYGLSSMVSRFIGIFLIPLYTKVLSPADYGSLNLVNSSFYFITVLAVFGLDSASARWYYDNEYETDRKKTIATWFWFQFITSIIIAIILCCFAPYISNKILAAETPILFIIPAVGLITSILPSIVTNWLRYQRKAKHTVIFTFINMLLNVGLSIFLVLILKKGVLGILLSVLISNGLASLYVFNLMDDWIKPKYFSLSRLKEMLKFSLPLIPTAVAFWVLNSSSAFVIEHFHGKSEVGLYAIGSMVASAVTMVVGSFQMAWGPFAFSIIDKPEAKKTYSMVLTIYTILMSTTALGVALFAKEAIQLFTAKEYHSAYLVAGFLCFNAIIYGYAYIAIIGCNVVKDNKPLAVAVLLAALLTAILYFLLVPILKKEGAALSIILGYIIVPIYLFYKSQKVWPIPFKFSLTGIIISLSIILFSINILFFDQIGIVNSVLIKIVLMILFGCCNFLIVRKFYPNMMAEIKLIFNKKVS